MKKAGTLTDDVAEELDAVVNMVGKADWEAFHDYHAISAKFKDFAGRTDVVSPFLVSDASDRHKAR